MISKSKITKGYLLIVFSSAFFFPSSIGNNATMLCRKAIETYLSKGERIHVPLNIPDIFNEKIPVFVSLIKNNKTRGCAGTFYAEKSFAENLIDFSIIAATQDFRYRPVDPSELQEIKIQITIPQQPYEIPSLAFYNPEKEGLIVEKNSNKGVVLPKEAKTADYALKMCLKNAGIKDTQGIRLLKFKAQIFVEEGK